MEQQIKQNNNKEAFKYVLNQENGHSAYFEKNHTNQKRNKCSMAIWWTIDAQEKIQKVDGVNITTVSPQRFLVSLLNKKYGITLKDFDRTKEDDIDFIKANITESTQKPAIVSFDLTQSQPAQPTQPAMNKVFNESFTIPKETFIPPKDNLTIAINKAFKDGLNETTIINYLIQNKNMTKEQLKPYFKSLN